MTFRRFLVACAVTLLIVEVNASPQTNLVETIEVQGPAGKYLLGKTEVTQSQWKAIRGDSPSRFPEAEGPVGMVNWFESVDFCNRLSLQEGLPPAYKIEGATVTPIPGSTGWRLPTSAEWEWAAQGGNVVVQLAFSGSDDPDEVAWTSDNSAGTTHRVGQKRPNRLGFFDMSGNVREWCADPGNDEISHVIRGGGFILGPKYCRVDYSDDLLSVYHNSDTGLRIARTIR